MCCDRLKGFDSELASMKDRWALVEWLKAQLCTFAVG
jgi:hypothetical protein